MKKVGKSFGAALLITSLAALLFWLTVTSIRYLEKYLPPIHPLVGAFAFCALGITIILYVVYPWGDD